MLLRHTTHNLRDYKTFVTFSAGLFRLRSWRYPQNMSSLELLLRDYEIRLHNLRLREQEADAQDLRSLEQSKITVSDRLAAQLGKILKIHGLHGGVWHGSLVSVGLGWVQLNQDSGDLLLPLQEIAWWEGGNSRAHTDTQTVTRKLSLGSALRAVATSRRYVKIFHSSSADLMSSGVLGVVGADYCELIVLGEEGGRHTQKVHTVPFAAIAAVSVASAGF